MISRRYFSISFIVKKVRGKGIVWCLRTGIKRVFAKPFDHLKRAKYLLSWLFPSFRSIFFTISKADKRILAIWDFRVVPFTVGELLYCQEMTLILREIHHVDKIDFVLVCDERQPARSDGGMTNDNFHFYFSKLLPVVFANPHLGSVMIMDSPDMLTKFIADNHERYIVFPPYRDNSGKYLARYSQYFNYMLNFFEENHYIPHLSCQPAMQMWARKFFADKVRPKFPVVVQLRNASTATYRNADLDCWFEFFAICEKQYNVTFVMIGEKDEIDTRFRQLSNVIVAKDYNTTVEQDLALIQVSMLFLGTTSGPMTMAMFSDLPYVIYGFRTVHERLVPGQQLPWATSLQKIVWEPETIEKLTYDFNWLFKQIGTEKWGENFDRMALEAKDKLMRRENFDGNVISGLEKLEQIEGR